MNGNMPEFGLVKNIFVVDSRVFCFEYQPFQTICFDRNIMAYQVEVPHFAQATELVDAEKLVDYTSYYTISSNSQTCVQVKYHLGDVIELHNSSNDSDITRYLNGQINVMATFIFQMRCAHSL